MTLSSVARAMLRKSESLSRAGTMGRLCSSQGGAITTKG